ncbi:DUF421 domain-containing protein [Bacillus infantis]|uniref:DUF421 domain-containing protein n=1 Tax=Bacillus infantis TaxID=324767 RepID=A0A5D4RIM2_9BACI|nr:DUF421 domain-containing protein [Bacillus infantis]
MLECDEEEEAVLAEYMIIIARTLFLYGVILLIFRLMGKREIGELSVLDLVVYIMIAEMAVVAIENPDGSLVKNILPMMLLMVIQIVLAILSLKSKKFRDIVDGKPSIIINQGKIDENTMRQQRYNFDDLLTQLRDKDIKNIADVEFAILEPSGKLSVFQKDNMKGSDIDHPLIIDGNLQEANLASVHKSRQWLAEQLKKKGYDEIQQISFCSYSNGNLYIDPIDEK